MIDNVEATATVEREILERQLERKRAVTHGVHIKQAAKALVAGTFSSAMVLAVALGCTQLPSADDHSYGVLLFVCVCLCAVLCCTRFLDVDDTMRAAARFFLSGMLFAPALAIVLIGCYWWQQFQEKLQDTSKHEATSSFDPATYMPPANPEMATLVKVLEARKEGARAVFDEYALGDDTMKAMDALVTDWKRDRRVEASRRLPR